MESVKTLKWALLGCGDIARRRVAPALRELPNCELTAVARARPELAVACAREFGARRWYTDWREAIADREIEAVYVSTPVHVHAEQTIAAAEAGKHVLCEKPMAMNAGECDRMIAACRGNKVKLGVAYYRHFYPSISRIRDVIASGEIGRPAVAQIDAFEWFDPAPDHPRRWLLERARSGGGPMFDFGCHRIEALVNICGPIKHVVSAVANVMFEREVEDTAVAVFQFQRGTVGVLTVTHAAIEGRDTLSIYGALGSVHVEVLNGAEVRIKTTLGERVESHPPASNVHRPLIEDFTGAVLADREPMVNGELGRQVAVIEDEIYAGVKW